MRRASLPRIVRDHPFDPPAAPAWHVYIVRTRDGSFYTGVTTDVARRLAEHRAADGRGARFLRGRAPLEIVYRRMLGEHGLALSA